MSPFLLSVACLASGASSALRAADPPLTEILKTNNLDFPARGALRMGFGAAYLHAVEIPFSGLAGDLIQSGVLRADAGVSDNVVVQIRGIVRQDLLIDESLSSPVPPTDVHGDRTHDVGDFSFATLVRAVTERERRPAIGFRLEMKLPNTNDTNGIGTNTTDIFLALLLDKRFGRFRLFTDTGVGILTEPTSTSSQNDVVVYGVGSTYALSPAVLLIGEADGRWSPSGSRPGTEDRLQLRAGLAWNPNVVTYAWLLTRGVTEHDENFGLAFDVSFGAQLFRRR